MTNRAKAAEGKQGEGRFPARASRGGRAGRGA